MLLAVGCLLADDLMMADDGRRFDVGRRVGASMLADDLMFAVWFDLVAVARDMFTLPTNAGVALRAVTRAELCGVIVCCSHAR